MISQRYTKVVYWDFDGVLNDVHSAVNQGMNTFNNTLITDEKLLKTFLELLDAENVCSLPISQRIITLELAEKMYEAFDKVFGKDRNYLKEGMIPPSIIEKAQRKGILLSKDKTPVIEEMKNSYAELRAIEDKNICVVDDIKEIVDNASKKGYLAVLVQRSSKDNKEVGTDQDRQHFADILVKLFSAEELLKIRKDLIMIARQNGCKDADAYHLNNLILKQMIKTYLPKVSDGKLAEQVFSSGNPNDIYKFKVLIRNRKTKDVAADDAIIKMIKERITSQMGYLSALLFNFKYWYNEQPALVKGLVVVGLSILAAGVLAGIAYGGFALVGLGLGAAGLAVVVPSLPQIGAVIVSAFTVASQWMTGLAVSFLSLFTIGGVGIPIKGSLNPKNESSSTYCALKVLKSKKGTGMFGKKGGLFDVLNDEIDKRQGSNNSKRLYFLSTAQSQSTDSSQSSKNTSSPSSSKKNR